MVVVVGKTEGRAQRSVCIAWYAESGLFQDVQRFRACLFMTIMVTRHAAEGVTDSIFYRQPDGAHASLNSGSEFERVL